MDLLDKPASAEAPASTSDSAGPGQSPTALHAIDWSFKSRTRAAAIESIHPYPAKFIGEIPRALLSLLPMPPGSAVFDPFCGSGTTLVEAQRLGIESVGVDLNPIACLISRVKTSEAPDQLTETANRIAIDARSNQHPPRWEIPNVDHWFQPDIQLAIAALIHELSQIGNPVVADALRLALSSILVRVSNQESDTRYAAIEKQLNADDVFSGFISAADKLNKSLLARDWPLHPTSVIQANTLTLRTERIERQIGMVITSPPYPNAYEYWLYHKYRMWWLGFDPLAVKADEIGARAHFFKTKHHTEQTFWEQMRQTFALLSKLLLPGAYACFVIGRSKIHGRIVENADIIETIARDFGFSSEGRFCREISASRKSFNLSHANIKSETILILQAKGSQ